MTMTRKDFIIVKNLLLKNYIENFVLDDSVFPSLSNFKLSDIIFGWYYLFSKIEEINYVDTIKF